jgi:hypothetical protein
MGRRENEKEKERERREGGPTALMWACLSANGPKKNKREGGAGLKEQDRPDWAKRRKGKRDRERKLEGIFQT